MSDIKIVSIVEGQGELDALPVLIRRVASAHAPQRSIAALRPIRVPRSKIVKQGELERAVTLAAYKMESKGGVLVVLDADDDCPAELGPRLLARAKAVARGRFQVSVVLAKFEFEAWFLAAADSLKGQRGLSGDLRQPAEPERIRDAKGWLSERMAPAHRYSGVLDQPALAACMSIEDARRLSDSFDKFYRDLTALIDSLSEPQEHNTVG